MNRTSRPSCAWVEGRPEDLDRRTLKQEFGKFGQVRKIYVNEEQTYAKVYFEDERVLKEACQGLQGYLSWNISYKTDVYKSKTATHFDSSSETSDRNVAEMNMDDYMELSTTECYDYVDVHGQRLMVLEGDEGELFVRLNDIRQTGFAVFKRDNYDPVITDKRQILKEFELHLLAEGKRYLLKTKANLRQEEILNTIQQVEKKLLGNDVRPQQTSYTSGRVVESSGKGITVTSENSQYRPNFQPKLVPAETLNRAPKNLQQNMGASHSNHNINNKFSRNNREVNKENRKYNTRNESENRQYNTRNESENRQYNTRNESENRQYNTRNESNAGQRQTNGFQREPRGTKPWDSQGARPKFNEEKPSQPAFVKSEPEESWGTEVKADVRKDKVETSSVGSSKTHEASTFPKLKLPIGSTEEVVITHIQKRTDKPNIYYVQLAKNADIITQILIDSLEKYPEQDVVEPEIGLPCLVEFEEVWYRAEVCDKSIPLIYLLDYGNREKNISGPLKVLPKCLAEHPAQAIRLTISRKEGEEPESFNIDDHLTINAKKQYDDGTYVVDVVKDDKSNISKLPETVEPEKPKAAEPEKPKAAAPVKTEAAKPVKVEVPKLEVKDEKELAYFDVPDPIDTLKDGEKVMLVDIRSNRLLVRTKLCVKQCKDINTYITSLDKKPIKELQKGQHVLCSKDGLNGLHRAIVTNISGPVATVDYVDYVGEGSLSVKSLRNIDEKLSKEPRTIIISPEYKPLENMKDESSNFLAQLTEQKAKLDVVMPNEKQFDLKLENGTLLSTKIQELDNQKNTEPPKVEQKKPDPPAPVKEEEPAYEPVCYDNMQFMEPTAGVSNYMCYTFVDTTEVTLLSTVDTAMEYLKRLMEIEVKDDRPYKPDLMEMCLASFKGPEEDTALWYRGVVVDKENDSFTINFVDYGNSEKLAAKDLRRYPANLKDIPILGMSAYLKGIPNTPAIVEKLKEFITDGSFHDVKIDNTTIEDNLKYGVEIPNLQQELKKAGLIK